MWPDLKRIPVLRVLTLGTALLGVVAYVYIYWGLHVCTRPGIGGLGTG